MIVHLAGNGRVLLTTNEDGEWNDLFYPYPGQFQHLREMRLGLFDEETRRFLWLTGGGGWLARPRWLPARTAPSGPGPGTGWCYGCGTGCIPTMTCSSGPWRSRRTGPGSSASSSTTR